MITTAGADPTQELADYADRVMSGKYKELAMGGQQTSAALTMLHDAARAGHWLCLKNLHLVVHWVRASHLGSISAQSRLILGSISAHSRLISHAGAAA